MNGGISLVIFFSKCSVCPFGYYAFHRQFYTEIMTQLSADKHFCNLFSRGIDNNLPNKPHSILAVETLLFVFFFVVTL